MSYSISEIAAILGLDFKGDGTRLITRVSNWKEADEHSLVFLESAPRTSRSGIPPEACVLGPERLIPQGISSIISNKPKLHFARAAELLNPRPRAAGIRHQSAAIAPDTVIEPDVDIGPFVTIGSGAKVSKGCILLAGVVVGEGCILGEDCILHPRTILYPGAELGDRVVLHAGVVIGGDGFGYVYDGHKQNKFPQVGKIKIEDDVEVGCNTTIDRGSLGVTRIGRGAKIDNLVQIAHNVDIGEGVVIAAQTGISGSSVIEEFAVIGGQVGFGDHTRVQKGVVIGSKAGILPGKIVRSGEVYWGVPVRPLREYKRLNALFGRLPELKKDIDSLKQAVANLQRAVQGTEKDTERE